MKKVILSVGIPGSGKSTYLKKFAEDNNYAYVCPDDIRKVKTKEAVNQTMNKQVWEEARKQVQGHLEAGKTVVFDATFTQAEQRREFLKFLRASGAEKIQGIYFDAPFEVAQERNVSREKIVPKHSMERMYHRELSPKPPSVEEGFDSLFTFDEYQKLLKLEKNSAQGTERKRFR